jgi:large subunit ribosomal protein L10
MNREQKSAAIAEIAGQIDESEAIFAVDYRGISVAEAAELRARLRDADATFKIVKNSLTERAADQAGVETLKEFLAGPTALTFVRGDVALAAKAVADYGRATQLLPFKGGLMGGAALDVEQIRSLSRLPAREVLYGQLVGVVASPVTGLVRSLGALLGGLAVALGQVREKKESGEIPAGEAPGAAAPPEASEAAAPAEAPQEPDGEPPAEAPQEPEGEPAAEAPQEPEPQAEGEAPAEPEAAAGSGQEADAAEGGGEAAAEDVTEPAADAPAPADDNKADVSAESQPEDAETSPKED